MKITTFRGLNNASDPLRAGFGWFSIADNVVVTDTGAIQKRGGYSLVKAGNISAMYSTLDSQRAYMVVGGVLCTLDGSEIMAGISPGVMHWAEINDQTFFNNGIDRGIIGADNTLTAWSWSVPQPPTIAIVSGSLPPGLYQVRCTSVLPDGRETGAGESAEAVLAEGQALQVLAPVGARVYIAPADSSVYQLAFVSVGAQVWNSGPESLGLDLLNHFLDPLPQGAGVIQFWKSRAYAAQYFPSEGQTVVWFSEPVGYHLFNLNSGFFIIPGEVTMLAPHDSALVIGTDQRIHAYTGEGLNQLAEYGVVPGHHWSKDDDRILFWTKRGVCSFPFSNLTERSVSVAPGVQAGGTIVRSGGQKRFVVAFHQGGAAFNAY